MKIRGEILLRQLIRDIEMDPISSLAISPALNLSLLEFIVGRVLGSADDGPLVLSSA